MIRRSGQWLKWGDEDIVAMARILGPDTATKGKTRIQDSVLKAAEKRGVLLSPAMAKRLKRAKRERVLSKRIRKVPDASPTGYPANRLARLFAHQRQALRYMEERPAYLLADQPGVGKTASAILWAWRRADTRVLVITPNSAKRQWGREIDRWTPDCWPVNIVAGDTRTQNAIAAESDGWVVAHWEALVHARKGLLDRPWDVVIMDEGQYMRNRKTQRSETAFKLVTPHRLVLTGHPFFNSPDELWSILHFLYPAEYTSFWRFFSMHVQAVPKRYGGFEVLGTRSRKMLRWEIAPFTLRRTKREVFKSLPPITRVPRELELTKRGRREYDKLKKQLFVELAAHKGTTKILAIPSVLARVTRIRQYLVDPEILGAKEKSVKYPAVAELLDELDGPPVVFTMFRQAAERLGRFLKPRRVGMIHGKIKEADREKAKRRFLRGKLDVLIVVIQAGGTALNLGKYGYVVFLDLPWTAADLEQAEGRVDRPEEGTGKTTPTTAYRLIVTDTYEENQEKMLEKKHGMFEEVFSAKQLEALF